MKRMHIHISVDDLDSSIVFYENLYGEPATVRKADYAKWVLDNPRVNFAISPHSASGSAVSHLGIEVDNNIELEGFNTRLQAGSDVPGESGKAVVQPEDNAQCCYAVSDKYWATDPGGMTWEFFHTKELTDTFGATPKQDKCCQT